MQTPSGICAEKGTNSIHNSRWLKQTIQIICVWVLAHREKWKDDVDCIDVSYSLVFGFRIELKAIGVIELLCIWIIYIPKKSVESVNIVRILTCVFPIKSYVASPTVRNQSIPNWKIVCQSIVLIACVVLFAYRVNNLLTCRFRLFPIFFFNRKSVYRWRKFAKI